MWTESCFFPSDEADGCSERNEKSEHPQTEESLCLNFP
jgi:hypothetical protein